MSRINRYRIAQMEALETRSILSEKYLKELLNKIEKYNDNPKSPYLLGNINVNRRENIIIFRKYKILRPASTLEEIDSATTKLNNEFELKLLFGADLKNNHPIVIIYRINKDIRTLPIIYKNNKDYLNKNYIRSLLILHGRTFLFISKLLENKLILSHSRKSLDDYDKLYSLRESIKNNLASNVNIYSLIKFYKSFITDNKSNTFNYFNFIINNL